MCHVIYPVIVSSSVQVKVEMQGMVQVICRRQDWKGKNGPNSCIPVSALVPPESATLFPTHKLPMNCSSCCIQPAEWDADNEHSNSGNSHRDYKLGMLCRENFKVRLAGLRDWWDAKGKGDWNITHDSGFLTMETQVDGDVVNQRWKNLEAKGVLWSLNLFH